MGRFSRGVLSVAAVAAGLLAAAPAEAGTITLIGTAAVPGNGQDLSGLTGVYTGPNGATYQKDLLGGFGSGIAYSGFGNRYVAVSDRGFADGTVPYDDRFHAFQIAVDPNAAPADRVRVQLESTTLLRNPSGQPYLGLSGDFANRFDPEAVRVGRTGQLYVSDEYGPYIKEFDQAGNHVRDIAVPDKFAIANPSANGNAELANNTAGRQANRGMEGLAISPDGQVLFGLMQNPLLQDGALNSSLSRVGVNNRLLTVDLVTGQTHEYLYQLDAGNLGTNEILAINDHQFLVVERDGVAGSGAAFKRIELIDTAGATDISGLASLPQNGLPPGVTAVTKSLFLDLLDPAFGLAGSAFPEKIEGLAFGPDLADGRHLLLVTSDNDLNPANPTRVFAFAIDRDLLPGYVPQTIVPEPGAFVLLGSGLAAVALARFRKARTAPVAPH